MKVNDREFTELQHQFEKDVSKQSYCPSDMRKEIPTEVPPGYFYCDSKVNAMFRAYMSGYQYGRIKASCERT